MNDTLSAVTVVLIPYFARFVFTASATVTVSAPAISMSFDHGEPAVPVKVPPLAGVSVGAVVGGGGGVTLK